jgi:hypothetical protein
MSNIDVSRLGDGLHRLVKLAMDTGEAATYAEAQALFKKYRLSILVGQDAAYSVTQQAALLTIVNTGRRSLLGGLEVKGFLDVPLLLPMPGYRTLAEAVLGLGAKVVSRLDLATPLIAIGNTEVEDNPPFAIRTTFNGWSGGIVPMTSNNRLPEKQDFVPAGVLAGSLAVAEVFQYLRRNNAAAGLREVGLSLWRPELDWRDPSAVGSIMAYLPSKLWLLGLGNLGQAYLWVLGLLPYATPYDVQLTLQDFDVLAESNDSTSVLTDLGLIGIRKTRAMANWAEQRGFKTNIIERRFEGCFRLQNDDPVVVLCGVDNAIARAALEDVGFSRIFEAGLGNGTSDFLAFRTHSFPASRTARDTWKNTGKAEIAWLDLPAYQSLAREGADRCGLTQLAGRTVGAPFVGTFAASLVIGEVLRLAHGAHLYELIDGHLRSLDHRTVILSQELPPINPGITSVEKQF